MLYLVRHGQTNDNKNHIIQGNKPLNRTGKKQVKETANLLQNINFDVCFCSPLRRAKQTLKTLKKHHKNLHVIFDDRLIERDYGNCVGMCYDSIPNYTQIRWNNNFMLDESVESPEEVYNRVAGFYDDILPNCKGKNILIVAHSGILRMTHFYFNGKPKDGNFTDFEIKNSQVLQIEN